jgi:hypothetical protein
MAETIPFPGPVNRMKGTIMVRVSYLRVCESFSNRFKSASAVLQLRLKDGNTYFLL